MQIDNLLNGTRRGMRIPRRESNHFPAFRVLGDATVHARLLVQEALECCFCDFGRDGAFVLAREA